MPLSGTAPEENSLRGSIRASSTLDKDDRASRSHGPDDSLVQDRPHLRGREAWSRARLGHGHMVVAHAAYEHGFRAAPDDSEHRRAVLGRDGVHASIRPVVHVAGRHDTRFVRIRALDEPPRSWR